MTEKKAKVNSDSGMMGFVLVTAFFGALVYFIQQADGFVGVLFAFVKAILWPAYMLHRALELMGV